MGLLDQLTHRRRLVPLTTGIYAVAANSSLVSLVLLSFSLRLKHERTLSLPERLSRIDFTGNAIFIASLVSILIAITWGGTVYDWSQYQVIVPLVLGFVGVGLFLAYEWTLAKHPSFPHAVFLNRTSATVLVITFIHTILTYWAFYFLPIYFQSVRRESPLYSGRCLGHESIVNLRSGRRF